MLAVELHVPVPRREPRRLRHDFFDDGRIDLVESKIERHAERHPSRDLNRLAPCLRRVSTRVRVVLSRCPSREQLVPHRPDFHVEVPVGLRDRRSP